MEVTQAGSVTIQKRRNVRRTAGHTVESQLIVVEITGIPGPVPHAVRARRETAVEERKELWAAVLVATNDVAAAIGHRYIAVDKVAAFAIIVENRDEGGLGQRKPIVVVVAIKVEGPQDQGRELDVLGGCLGVVRLDRNLDSQ